MKTKTDIKEFLLYDLPSKIEDITPNFIKDHLEIALYIIYPIITLLNLINSRNSTSILVAVLIAIGFFLQYVIIDWIYLVAVNFNIFFVLWSANIAIIFRYLSNAIS